MITLRNKLSNVKNLDLQNCVHGGISNFLISSLISTNKRNTNSSNEWVMSNVLVAQLHNLPTLSFQFNICIADDIFNGSRYSQQYSTSRI